MMKENGDDARLIEALKQLLISSNSSTQDALCKALGMQGFEVNQSKISRLLRKVNAVKVVNLHGQIVYSLKYDPAPPNLNTPLKHLILDVSANEALVVISTSPGSASMVARMLDHVQISIHILGTIAGDDTVFVAPKSINNIDQLLKEIKRLLSDRQGFCSS